MLQESHSVVAHLLFDTCPSRCVFRSVQSLPERAKFTIQEPMPLRTRFFAADGIHLRSGQSQHRSSTTRSSGAEWALPGSSATAWTAGIDEVDLRYQPSLTQMAATGGRRG